MMKESIIIPYNTPVQDIIRNATNYISKNWNVSRNEILELVISLDLDGGGGVSNNTMGREECAEHICVNIRDMKLILEGKNTTARYSAHTINIDLSIFLRSK